jgi:hypothetical protein
MVADPATQPSEQFTQVWDAIIARQEHRENQARGVGAMVGCVVGCLVTIGVVVLVRWLGG